MQKIDQYSFVDCVLVDFKCDFTIKTIEVSMEAYYPSRVGTKRTKGVIKLIINDIAKLSIEKTSEFEFDIALEYSKVGEDVKANEIYFIRVEVLNKKQTHLMLKSDMLTMSVTSSGYELIELIDV